MPHLTPTKTANKCKNDGFASSTAVKIRKKPQKFYSSAIMAITARRDLEIPGRGLRFVCALDSLPQEQFLWPREAAAAFLKGSGGPAGRLTPAELGR